MANNNPEKLCSGFRTCRIGLVSADPIMALLPGEDNVDLNTIGEAFVKYLQEHQEMV